MNFLYQQYNPPLLFFIILLGVLAQGKSQNLTAGPMLGHTSHRSAQIWMEVGPNVHQVVIEYSPMDKIWDKQSIQKKLPSSDTYQPVTLTLHPLTPHTTYRYQIHLNGHPITNQPTYQFTTARRRSQDASNYSFLLGSCTYLNSGPEEHYGQSPSIFKALNNTPGHFMIWMGDNTYLRSSDYSSKAGIQYRYHTSRQLSQLQPFLHSRPHYAIWDDHDYGPNNSDRNFIFKKTSLHHFQQYWANPSYGLPGHPGIYTHFQKGDAAFFLTDNRYYRAPNALRDSVNHQPSRKKTYFGSRQLQWLKESLLTSNATFKFIVVGNQFINKANPYEGVRSDYPFTFQQLISFIKKYQIEGVVFLSGDRHLTELLTFQPEDCYSLYEFTCSPLTSSPYTGIKETSEMHNPQRIPGTLVLSQNYGRIHVSGPEQSRVLHFQSYNKEGRLLWQFRLPEEALTFEE